MSDFRDGIVSYIDLNDVGKILLRESRRGVRIMRQLHSEVASFANQLASHREICFWQDSVMLLGDVDNTTESYRKVMSDVVLMKDLIQRIHPCHAVCVKGQAFPLRVIRSKRVGPRVTYLATSSLAFANVFAIERKLGGSAAAMCESAGGSPWFY